MEGEWEMEGVESKLHLFGCQQKDLEKFHKVGIRKFVLGPVLLVLMDLLYPLIALIRC
jgi:hypothetical protein